jgi:hypothetical protein
MATVIQREQARFLAAEDNIMNFYRYFSALFVATALSASPMIIMAEGDSDHRNSANVEASGEQQREQMVGEEQRQEWSDDSLAQLGEQSEESGEPLASGYCFTESMIDENTGEIIAFQQICEEMMADVA